MPAVVMPNSELYTFLRNNLDAAIYLELNTDVRAAGVDPILHYMQHGIHENRQTGSVTIRPKTPENTAIFSSKHEVITLDGCDYVVERFQPQHVNVVDQILGLAKYEPALLAPGKLALTSLRSFPCHDLFMRRGIDAHSLLDRIPEIDIVFLIPWIVIGGAEKYTADLVQAFADLEQRVLVIVTGQTAAASGDWTKVAILKPFARATIVFLDDHCSPHIDKALVLARLLNALSHKIMIVINSQPGLEMVARFGRPLAAKSRLYCAYFGLGVDGLGAAYGTHFPRETSAWATSLTDNSATGHRLDELYGKLGKPAAIIPPRMPTITKSEFESRKHLRRMRPVEAEKKWCWVSRVEPLKGTHVLSEIAALRPKDTFDVFGPAKQELGAMGIVGSNVAYRGIIADVAGYDFSGYDGFLFTSLLEGFPNVVLEMATQAIPMVLADVGGIRDTFDEGAAVFVRYGENGATAFCAALEQVAHLPVEQVLAMTDAAFTQALARHSGESHARAVTRVFRSEECQIVGMSPPPSSSTGKGPTRSQLSPA